MFSKIKAWYGALGGREATAGQIADALEGFLDGTGGEWDWDELESTTLRDPELEQIRQTYILGTGRKRPPPYEASQYEVDPEFRTSA